MFPFIEQLLRLLEQDLLDKHNSIPRAVAYLLLTRLADVPVGLEQRANVHGLTAPELSLDGPVEGQFQRPSVEGAVGQQGSDWGD